MRKFFTNSIRFALMFMLSMLFIGAGSACGGGKSEQSQFEADDEEPYGELIIESGLVEADESSDDEALRIEVQYDGFDPDVNYMDIIIQSCLDGNAEAGREAAEARNKKIKALEMTVQPIDYDDLNELSKIITSEAGSDWLSMEWKMRIGEVVLNRVASPEYPNTIYDVIHQTNPIQYDRANGTWFKTLIPYKNCVIAAARLLNGERLINEPSVVYQAQSKQGSGVYLAMYDSYYGYTYLCYSSHPELYATEE